MTSVADRRRRRHAHAHCSATQRMWRPQRVLGTPPLRRRKPLRGNDHHAVAPRRHL